MYCTSNVISRGCRWALADSLMRSIQDVRGRTQGDQYIELEAFLAADKAFHDAIVLASENRRLHDIYANLNIHIHVLCVSYFSTLNLPERVAKDHWAIHHAIRDAAPRAVQHHLRHFCAKMVRYIQKHDGAI